MRTAPPSITAQQKRYDLGARLWKFVAMLPHLMTMGFSIALIMDPGSKHALRPFVGAILAFMAGVVVLNPWGRSVRYRQALRLLVGKVVRYEAGDSVNDADLAEAAAQADAVMQTPLPPLWVCWKRA